MTGTGGSKPIRLPDETGFASLSMMVWRRGPVTAEALVNRFSDKLGSPVVTRTFDRDEIGYQWRTQYGTTVDLLEGLTGDGQPPQWSVLLPKSLVQKTTGYRWRIHPACQDARRQAEETRR